VKAHSYFCIGFATINCSKAFYSSCRKSSAEGVATFAAAAIGEQWQAVVEGVTTLVAAAAVAVARLPVSVVVQANITEKETAATSAVEVATAARVTGIGRLVAGVVVALVDGKATSAFRDKSILELCTSA
jgi:cytochrome bd-type quinol oxidase subunit 2